MPDITGEMTPDEIAEVQRRLHARWTSVIRDKCPMCNLPGQWEIDSNLGKVDVADWRPLAERSSPGAARHFPAVVITCKHCGYMLLFNAVVLGVLKRYPSDSYAVPTTEDANG